MEKGFVQDPPTSDGWYDVIFEPGDHISRVYITVCDGCIAWGWDESDDPQCVGVDVLEPEKIQYRKVP